MPIRTAVLSAVVLTLTAVSGGRVVPQAQAQAVHPDTGALARIAAEARAGSRLMETAGYLTDIYGPRLTGSPHLRAAGTFVVEQLKKWGITSARFERWGPFGPGWTTDRFVALVASPSPYPLLAFPKAWTPGTGGSVVANAVLAVIENERDFDTYRGTLKGAIVLTAPVRPNALPAPRRGDPRYSAEELRALTEPAPAPAASSGEAVRAGLEFARKRMEFYVNEGVIALLEPGGYDGAVFVGDGRMRDDAAFAGQGFYPWPDAVASQVVVSSEQYNRIARTLQSGTPVTVELDIASDYHPAEPDSFNIVAELPGTDLSGEVVMLGAHFDSAHAATGAADDAAGCVVMLEAMRILRASGLKTRRTIRLALWTGAEQGHLGARFYVTQNFADPASMELRPDHARLSAYFNLDRGAGAIRGLYLQGNTAAAPMLERWLAPLKPLGATALSPRFSMDGDHQAFDAVGLPAFDFIQDPGEYEARIRHSNLDTFDRLNGDVLIQNAVLVAFLAYEAANQNGMVPRKPVPPPDKAAAGPWSPGR
ncbi:MAG: M20/M25/M40 family metallo-hydrolase [Vicinamibacterales bacterium]